MQITSQYTHLGTVVTEDLGPKDDVQRKLARGVSALRPLASKVLRREDVPIAKRKEICLALGPSAAGFNCEVWGHFPADVAQAWLRGHDSMYRMLFREDRGTHEPRHPTVYEVCGAAELPVPQARISIARILYAGRVVRLNLSQLWSLLELEAQLDENSWLSGLRADLCWLRYWCSGLRSVSFESMMPAELAVWLSASNLRGLTRQAWRAQTATLRVWDHWQFQQRSADVLKGVKGLPAIPENRGLFKCPKCDYEASSGAQLAGHFGAVHEHVNVAWRYVQGATCRICLKNFWTPRRLFDHLNRPNGCLAQAIVALEPVDDWECLRASGTLDCGDRRNFRKAPVTGKAGPLRKRPEDLFEHLIACIHECSCFERRAICVSARRFFPESDALEAAVEAMEPTKLCTGSGRPPIINPDGRVWMRQGFQSPS